jgi:hypothetical protein
VLDGEAVGVVGEHGDGVFDEGAGGRGGLRRVVLWQPALLVAALGEGEVVVDEELPVQAEADAFRVVVLEPDGGVAVVGWREGRVAVARLADDLAQEADRE